MDFDWNTFLRFVGLFLFCLDFLISEVFHWKYFSYSYLVTKIFFELVNSLKCFQVWAHFILIYACLDMMLTCTNMVLLLLFCTDQLLRKTKVLHSACSVKLFGNAETFCSSYSLKWVFMNTVCPASALPLLFPLPFLICAFFFYFIWFVSRMNHWTCKVFHLLCSTR